ncbi:Predicted glycosyl hydrolase [Chlamydia abortus]|nr:Predicted glycosyl hydrolase [Chlamydia abortus]
MKLFFLRKPVILILTALIIGTIPTHGFAAEDNPPAGDTLTYSFKQLGLPGQTTQPGWNVVGDANAAPKLVPQIYGVQMQSSLNYPTRSFEFEVPEDGNYWIRFSGYWSPNGGTADLSVDGDSIGRYSFYSVTGGYGPLVSMDTIPLTSGKHVFTLKVTDKGNGLGNGNGYYLYPSELILLNTDRVTSSKTRSTVYTPEKMAAARQNVERFAWAKNARDAAVSRAEEYLKLGYERLWELVPPQSLPRSYNTNQFEGNLSPVTGEALKELGNYPWVGDPVNEPWKITDPTSGYKFPTNDFGAYYRSGLDEHGIFDPKKADRSLLVNTLYPEKGPDWGVDDGFGWVDPETGKRYTFIAYYTHWFLWMGGNGTAVIPNALNSFRDAYIYTGDMKYARAGIILLDRIADIYPSMDLSAHDSNIYLNSHGGVVAGKATGSIWETAVIKDYVNAYDAFFSAIDDPETISFLRAKGEQYRLPLKTSAVGIRRNIEDGILRQVYPAVQRSQIRGNNGYHQSALALAAVVHDTLPETKEWLDFTFQAGGLVNRIPYTVTGGNILVSMVNDVDRDGHGNEAAPGYNASWINPYMLVADILRGYDKYPAADLYQNVKFQKMFSSMIPLTMIERYTPQIGDSGTTGNPGLNLSRILALKAFEVYGDPIFAQVVYFLNNNRTEGIHGDIFSADPEKIAADIEAVIAQHGPLNLDSVNLTGYGFTALRDGIKAKFDFGVPYSFPLMPVSETNKDYKLFEATNVLQFEATAPGDYITFDFEVTEDDEYELSLKPLHGATYGKYAVKIDGSRVAEFDFFGSGSEHEAIAKIPLTAGTHTITFECIGKNEAATGYKAGLIEMSLLNAEEQARRDDTYKDTSRDIWMYYGRNGGHGHRDTLNLGLHAFGLDLLPELGYPEQANATDKHRHEWMNNTISHNTVMVDRSKQNVQWVSQPKHYDDADRVQLIDVEAPKVYPQTELYRRTTAMIRVDDENSYAIDFFRVKGGSEHHFSFHAAEGPVSTEGLNLTAQPSGTYAGPDVPFGERPADDSVPGTQYMGPGFHWLRNVERDNNPSAQFSLDWDVTDTWKVLQTEEDIHLRLTMLGEIDDVALADGVPPRNKPGNPKSLKYMIAHRSGEQLSSLFTSVIEPYKDNRFIRSISPVSVHADGVPADDPNGIEVKAVKVELANGRTDYIVSALDSGTRYTIDGKLEFQGFFGVYSEQDGRHIYSYVNDGTAFHPIGKTDLTTDVGAVSGTVTDFTKEMSLQNSITVQLDRADARAEEWVGRTIFIENDGTRNAAYIIKGVIPLGGPSYRLDIGDATTIRSFVDNSDFSKGYVYDLEAGASFRIPLSASWELPSATVDSMIRLTDEYIAEEAVRGPLANQLRNSLRQAQHHQLKGDTVQAAKHMENFLKHINNEPMQEHITPQAKSALVRDAQEVIASLLPS